MTLYAGPWVGEFGWELCSWNPSLRHIAKEFDHVTVEIQPGMEYLYEFADEIIINPRESNFDMYKGTPSKPPFKAEADVTSLAPMVFWNKHAKTEFRVLQGKGLKIQPKEWRKLGTEKTENKADIMCAFRGPKRYRGRTFREKQWPDDRCVGLAKAFVDKGYTVACYGGKDNLHVKGTLDLRGLPLIDLCGALAGAKLAIGPSSGPLHLASLCGTTHVTWYGRPQISRPRYVSHWNPFKTKVYFISNTLPNIEQALKVGVKAIKDGSA